jgi:hypothetical protein
LLFRLSIREFVSAGESVSIALIAFSMKRHLTGAIVILDSKIASIY